jgi:hypothetical protein
MTRSSSVYAEHVSECRDDSVGITAGGVRLQEGIRGLSLLTAHRPTVVPIQPLLEWVLRPGRLDDRSFATGGATPPRLHTSSWRGV